MSATTAALTAEAGVAVFKVAYEHWLADKKRRALTTHIRAALGELESIVVSKEKRRTR